MRIPGYLWLLVLLVIKPVSLRAEPEPGDLFREYRYTNTYGDAGGSIRVGGKRGESYPDRGSDFGYINAWIEFPHQLDLEHAERAEIVVEKILSHNGTRGFAIQWNAGDWIALPEPVCIPEPRRDYYHHTCITLPIHLSVLNQGKNVNRFRMRVSPEHDWNWPQHLVYGVHLRIYYDPRNKQHAAGRVSSLENGDPLGREVPLAVRFTSPLRRINRVDYLGRYEGINWEGDGRYRRWHYFFYHGELTHHLGSSVTFPFHFAWNTEWIPDQSAPLAIAARIEDDTGLIYMTPAVTDLSLSRQGFSVELCKPQNVPANWVTRRNSYEESVTIHGDLANAVAAQLVWSSWSSGYMNGVFVNDALVLQNEGPRYRYFDHRVPIEDLHVLKPGKNKISTGKTPLYDGKMVHGMEVNWPGIQMLIQYRTDQ